MSVLPTNQTVHVHFQVGQGLKMPYSYFPFPYVLEVSNLKAK